MTIGERVKQEREKRGLDRADLKRLTGISMAYLHEVEANVFLPSEERLEKIADALGMTVEALSEDVGKVTFGERLTALRESKGWTVDALARESGLAKSHIRYLENNVAKPGSATIKVLARSLGVSPEELE